MFDPVDPHPDFPKMEEEVLKYWEREKVFEKSVQKTKSGKPFVFYEGPPTANAAPGIHHVEARSFKDVIPRFQTMRGRYVLRKAGWDTHGLPVELQIEKKLGISGKKQIESLKGTVAESIAYFNALCRESVWQFKEEWEKLTKRMGYWIDLEHPYITYENSYIESVWGVLKKVWDKKLIYQGHKVVPYCPRCGTALSSHEVAQGYEKVKENSVYVKFKVKDQPDTYLLSWTTTPWTLPGNVALAVGKDIDYMKVRVGDEFYLLAKDRLPVIAIPSLSREKQSPGDRHGLRPRDDIEVAAEMKGKDLVGLEYEPLFDIPALKSEKSYKVYAADFVTTEEGTGIVHTAVMYGEDDYQLGEKVGLPKHHTVDEEGKFTADLKAVGLAGKKVKDKETEQAIVQYLKEKNLMLREEVYEHDYPFCWRCGTALLYYARNSWFIKMSSLRRQLLKNNEGINWVPDYIKEGRFGEWLREVKDWAISRERYWGTPLPFWQCEKCGEYEAVGSLGELRKLSNFAVFASGAKQSQKQIAARPSGARNDEPTDLHRPYVDEIKLKCKKCGGDSRRVPEVLDVWFDSGAMPFAQGTDQFPADFISEAIDQTRGWFYTLLAVSTLLGKKTPYRNVICLGHVLDAKGEKMSKSKGNIVDPWQAGDKYGFDAIRWYFYSINQPGDSKRFAEADLQTIVRGRQLILWNIYSYFVTYANANGWLPKKQHPKEKKHIMDEWLLARQQELVNLVTQSLEKYDLFRASRALETFIEDFSTWYIRRSRGRSDESFFETTHHVLVELCRLLAPFMPFLSDNIYRSLGEEDSVHLSKWTDAKKLGKAQEQVLEQMKIVRDTVERAHALRAQAKLKLRQPLQRLTVEIKEPAPELEEILRVEVNVLSIAYGKKLELDTAMTPELRIAGLTRELERQINQFRKEAGLRVGEEIELQYETESASIEKAIGAVDRKKTYLKSLVKGSNAETKHSKDLDIEGEKVRIGFKILSTKSEIPNKSE